MSQRSEGDSRPAGELSFVKLNSVEWTTHISLVVERELRRTDDEQERRRLKGLRDWHDSSLTDEQVAA
jgi:hypothetical protein